MNRMTDKLHRRITAAGTFLLICILPMCIPIFFSRDSRRHVLLESFCSIPFWLAASVVIGAAGIGICFFACKCRIDTWIGRASLSIGAVCLAALCIFSLFTKVIDPLRDIPYLNSSASARLENVRFYYNNIGDSPDMGMEGISPSGEKMVFAVSKDTYKEGEGLCLQADKMQQMVTAEVEYLPYSGIVTRLDIQVEGIEA